MFRVERNPLLVATLAVCLARRAFPEVVFVTDLRGAALARALGWQFDSVSLGLERLQADGLEHVWALGKLAALLEQPCPCVQFDGDVLLLKPLPRRLEAAPLLAQSPDVPSYYGGRDMLRGLQILGLPRRRRAYNAGLLGGADVALLHDYAAAALELAAKFRDLGHEVNGTTASMLVEQYSLGVFARSRGVEVRTLLPRHPSRRHVARVGYVHLVGNHKRHPLYVEKVERRLAADFPEAYAAFLAGWQALERSTEAPTAGGFGSASSAFPFVAAL